MTGCRLLGRTELNIPPLVVGTMARGSADPTLRKSIFRHAIEQGLTTFDTAPLYGFGDTERQLGRVLAEYPGTEVQVLGKVGLNWRGGQHGPVHFAHTDKNGRRFLVRRDSRPESVRLDVEESLRRLGRERLDLAQVHFRDTDTPIQETMEALAELRREGKIRAIGVCNFTLKEVREAVRSLRSVPLASVQLRLNLLQRAPLDQRELVPWCLEHQIGVLAYSPLAEGRLARCPADPTDAVSRALVRLSGIAGRSAEDNGAGSMAAVAVGWVINQPGLTAAIVGVSGNGQLDAVRYAREIDGQTIDAAEGAVRGVRLHDPWEGPAWKRRLRGLKGRILRR